MTTSTILFGSRTQLSGAAAALNSLASATYVVLGTLSLLSSSKVPLAVKVEVSVTPGTVSSLKQVSIFAQLSLDNTNFTTGPASGTTTTDEPNLVWIGTIPCNTNSTLQRAIFDLTARLAGINVPYVKLIAKNETGAALAGSGNDVYTITGSGDTA